MVIMMKFVGMGLVWIIVFEECLDWFVMENLFFWMVVIRCCWLCMLSVLILLMNKMFLFDL